jgi:hypothetical protein
MSRVTYYHSNVRLSLTEFFCSFTLFSLTTNVLILLIKRLLLKFKSKKTFYPSILSIHTPGNYPKEENTRYSQHGESLKTRLREPYYFVIKIVLFHSFWNCFNRVDVYLWRGTKSFPHIFLKCLGVLSSRYIIVLREGVNCPTSKFFSKFLVPCFIKFNYKWTKEIFDVKVRKACVSACCWSRRENHEEVNTLHNEEIRNL